MQGHSTSAYETWVRRLRQWQADTTTPLDDLPVLDHDMFTPSTYQRLLGHIEKALEVVTQRWSERLVAAFGASSGHDLARNLVALRPLLARRVQLAQHPSLPPVLRQALTKESSQTLARLQEELERDIERLGREGRMSRPDTETMLRAVRENSLERVVDMEIPTDGSAPRPKAVTGTLADARRAGGLDG